MRAFQGAGDCDTVTGPGVALNEPMGGQPGGGSIGVETADVLAEHRRLSAIGDIDLDPEPMQTPGAPLLFMMRDPDGNHIAVPTVRSAPCRWTPISTIGENGSR